MRVASVAVDIPGAICDAIVDHCRQGLPNEACGLIAGDAPAWRGGRALRWLPARNGRASPYRFELHPDDLVRLALDIDDAGQVVWAIVHSHVASPAVPSPADVRELRHPEALQVIVSFDAPDGSRSGQPDIRAWRLVRGVLDEVPVVRPPAPRAAS